VAVNLRIVIGGFFNKKIHVWKRRTGEYVQLVNAESNMIYGIKASENMVATSLVNGVVKIYAMAPRNYLLTHMHTLHTGGEKSRQRKQANPRKFTFVYSDTNILLNAHAAYGR
jgi:hypothetical protein